MDIKAILILSPIGKESSSKIIFAFFSEGTDSPVKADSSIFKFALSIRRTSAGIYLPASIIIISPGTTSFEGISKRIPSLFTIAFGVLSFFKDSKAFSALYSWTTPIIAFINITISIIIESLSSPIIPDIIAAIRSI